MLNNLIGFFLICFLAGFTSLGQAANIFLDEDFEEDTAFADRSWPIKDQSLTPPSLTPKGANLRADDSGAKQTEPKPTYVNTGTIVTDRYFQGTKSLALASGQSVKCDGPIPQAGTGEIRLIQFALSTNVATTLLPAGTQVGHFKFDWSINTATEVETSLILNFVTSNTGKIDIKCKNNGITIGSLTGKEGNWLMISLLTNSRVLSSTLEPIVGAIWRVYDPFTNSFKGPQPLNPMNPINSMVDTDFRSLSPGTHIYVNDTKTTITTVRPNDYGPGWGNNNIDTDLLNTSEQGWEIVAENSGVLYLDDMYWDQAVHVNPTQFMEQEAGGRMAAFDEKTTELGSAAAQTWSLY